MSEAPPDVPLQAMLNQVGKDIVAAEKLKVLEKDGGSRLVPERRGQGR